MKITYIDLDDVKNPLLGAGQARATNEVGKRLVTRGHVVTVVSSRYPGSHDRFEDGIEYRHIGIGSPFLRLNNFAFLIAALLYTRSITPETCDVIMECFTAPVSSLHLPRVTDIPVVAVPSMFNAKEFSRKYHLPFDFVERTGVPLYRFALPYSDVDSGKFTAANPSITYKIVPQGVGDEFFGLTQKTPKHILFLSRFDISQKGIDLLLLAYSRVKDSIGLPLVLAGHGPDEARIRHMIHSLKLDHEAILVGPAYGRVKADLMTEAAFVAFPSRHDEMCLWTLEALAGGLPIVCFDLPESGWIHQTVSYKAPAFDTEAYAQLLSQAAREAAQRKKRAACRQFARKYSWDNVVNEYESFLSGVVAQSNK